MSDERALYVRVAEALRWKDCWDERQRWTGFPPRPQPQARQSVPRYDTDWSATGPLIERLEIGVETCDECRWVAGRVGEKRRGPTPLVAVCNWILALAEAGKLPR